MKYECIKSDEKNTEKLILNVTFNHSTNKYISSFQFFQNLDGNICEYKSNTLQHESKYTVADVMLTRAKRYLSEKESLFSQGLIDSIWIHFINDLQPILVRAR